MRTIEARAAFLLSFTLAVVVACGDDAPGNLFPEQQDGGPPGAGGRKPASGGTEGVDASTSGGSGGRSDASGGRGASGGSPVDGGGGQMSNACVNSLDCAPRSDDKTVCDRGRGVCVECVAAADCGDSADCVNSVCESFTACESGADCPSDLACDTMRGRCVTCVEDSDCANGETCVASACRLPCASDNQCTPMGLLCDFDSGLCAECATDTDCPDDAHCLIGSCEEDLCTPGETACRDGAVVTCDQAGSTFETTQACGGGTTCIASGRTATCETVECTPNEPTCENNRAVTCNAAGTGTLPGGTDCGALGQTCVAGECREGCELTQAAPDAVPTAIYVMLDQSGSMVTDPLDIICLFQPTLCNPTMGTPTSKWDTAVTALTDFVHAPASAGLRVALGLFPQTATGGGTADSCVDALYATPIVAMGELPGNAESIESALAAAVPTGETPTASALRGLTGYCIDYVTANPNQHCVGVFISDGVPSQCDPMDGAGLSMIAGAALTAGVQTYVVGMEGADFTILNAIAEAGGTNCDPASANAACDASTSPGAIGTALASIRGQSACDYRLPAGSATDLGDANLTYEPRAGGSQFLPRTDGAADCAAGGWYPVGSGGLRLCPSTCSDVHADGGQLRVDLGCN